MPPLSILIKPASGLCNLDCTYCFYHDITNKREQGNYGFMSKDTMNHVIHRALEFAEGRCTFAFQGGEPTLIGLSFYEEFVATVKKLEEERRAREGEAYKHLEIHYALQTNGYELDERWAEFLAREKFLVGVSLDGTIHTHNLYRKNNHGEGTFKGVMDTIHLFDAHEVLYNILTVVNKKTAQSVQKVYAFFKKNHFQYLQFIPCLDPIGEKSGQEPYSLTPEVYGQFLCELFDLWYEDQVRGTHTSIRLFDNYISILRGGVPESCDMRGACSYQHVIEADGSVYPCDFYVLDTYRLGYVKEESFEQMRMRRQALRFVEASMEHAQECKSCSYYQLCRGGCKRHREMAEEDPNYFCKAYSMFFEHALERMIRLSRYY